MAPSIQPGQGGLPPLHAGSPMQYKDGQIHFDQRSQSAYVEVNVKVDDHTTKTLKVTVHGVASKEEALEKVNTTLVKSVAIAMMHFDTGVKKVTIDKEKTVKHTETESKEIKRAVNLTSDLHEVFEARGEKIQSKTEDWGQKKTTEKFFNLDVAKRIANLGSRTLTPEPRIKEKEVRKPADDLQQPLEFQGREALEDEADLSQFVDTSSNAVESNEELPEAAVGKITDHSSKQLHSMLDAAEGFTAATSKLVDDLKEQPQSTTGNPRALDAFMQAANENPFLVGQGAASVVGEGNSIDTRDPSDLSVKEKIALFEGNKGVGRQATTSKPTVTSTPTPTPIPQTTEASELNKGKAEASTQRPPAPLPRTDLNRGPPPPLPPRDAVESRTKEKALREPTPDLQARERTMRRAEERKAQFTEEAPEPPPRSGLERAPPPLPPRDDPVSTGRAEGQAESKKEDLGGFLRNRLNDVRRAVEGEESIETTDAYQPPPVTPEKAKADPPAQPQSLAANQEAKAGGLVQGLQDEIKRGYKLKKAQPSSPKPEALAGGSLPVNDSLLGKAREKGEDIGLTPEGNSAEDDEWK